jgi:hypothetical protein
MLTLTDSFLLQRDVLHGRKFNTGAINSDCKLDGNEDRLCGLVVIVGLERGPLSLVSTTEELLDRNVAAPV